MKVRKRIIYKARKRNAKAELTKSLALILFYQMKVANDQKRCNDLGAYMKGMRNFTYNKMRQITGLHANTIKKRLSTAMRMGWAKLEKGDLHIDCKAIKSSHHHNNYTISNAIQSIKELQDFLLSYIIVNIQETKDYVKDVFNRLKWPKDLKEYKKVRRFAKERHPGKERFEDRGTSYKCIAANAGTGTSTAKRIVRFAEKKGLIKRRKNIEQVDATDGTYMRQLASLGLLDEYLQTRYGRIIPVFFTHLNSYICFPNSYIVLQSSKKSKSGNY